MNLRGVFVTAGLLDAGSAATAHVDLGTRKFGRTSTCASDFEDRRVGSRIGRLDRRAGPRAAEADDRDVGLEAEGVDLRDATRAHQTEVGEHLLRP